MPRKNTPDLWNDLWNREISPKEDAYNLTREERSIRFQRIEKAILDRFRGFEGLNVIEIGAGAGTNAALSAKRGATVTVLDYSEMALERSREFFERNGLTADHICADALDLPDDLLNRFDVSMSFGLSEHFKGKQRLLINKSHLDVLKEGGLTFVSVPNSLNLPYRIYKLAAETLGVWKVGEEYPYTRRELSGFCETMGIRDYFFIGDSIYSSLQFINPLRVMKRILRSRDDYDISKIKREKGSRLDEYLSYALVLCASKDQAGV